MHRPTQGYKPSSTSNFFRNARGLGFYQSMFTSVCGDMVIYPIEQPSLWNKYRLVDFDQQTLRHLHTSSTGVVTVEMEPMASTSRIKVYRIHYYEGREAIFCRHLEYAKSLLAHRRDIPQFLGTSIDNADHKRFIVLSGGASLSLSGLLIKDPMDFKMRKIASLIIVQFFQLVDVFKTSPFAPLYWSWPKFWDLPVFSTNSQLLVDMILLESHDLVTSSQSNLIAGMRSRMGYYQVATRDRAYPGDMECILQSGQELTAVTNALKRGTRALRYTLSLSSEESLFESPLLNEKELMELDSEEEFFEFYQKWPLSSSQQSFEYSTSKIEELSDDEMDIGSDFEEVVVSNLSDINISLFRENEMDIDI